MRGIRRRVLLKDGVILNPADGFFEKADLLFESTSPGAPDGRILAVGKDLPPDDAVVVDCSDLFVSPGFIDMHCHLREPGETHKETIETGCRSAVAGGFTTICCMPNTKPPLDSAETIGYVRHRGERLGRCEVLPIAAVSVGMENSKLTEMAALAGAGAIAFSDDGYPIQDASFLLKVLEYSRTCDGLVILHPEDKSLTAGGQVHDGLTALILGLRGMPREAEYLPVQRATSLAARCGARIHIAHVSVKESIEIIRKAREAGFSVSAEVTPHHLLLTDSFVKGYRTEFKMNPPLREPSDTEALQEALKEGAIDCVATDHAPHSDEEKETTFDDAPFGVIGFETAFPVLWTELVVKRQFPALRLIEALTTAPAKILRIRRGNLKPGFPADIIIFDPNKNWEIMKEGLRSKSRNTCFDKWKVVGMIVTTFFRGRLVYLARDFDRVADLDSYGEEASA